MFFYKMEKYKKILKASGEGSAKSIRMLERFAFYDEAKKAYAVIATSETSQYANVILQKGCIIQGK